MWYCNQPGRGETKDSEIRARIGGVASQMETFDFFFGIELGLALSIICYVHCNHLPCQHVKLKR